MISNMTIYEGAFVNIETNTANENIQQLISVRLFDTETPVNDNPFNVRYRVTSNRDGTQTVVITWGELPEATQGASFGYHDGTDWVDTEIDITKNKAIINVPEGDWLYSFFIDYESGTDPRYQLRQAAINDLELGETPIKISVIDNNEDKFTQIRSKQAEIQVHTGNGIDISTFAEGGDNRFYVEIETQVEGLIFCGFLSISDLSQEFQPDPNILILTATDGLGFLNDEPLVNFEGENPQGVYPIIKFIAWALARTGLSLDIKACMNIREEFAVPLVSDDSGAGHFYTHEHIDARTFEDEIGVSEDCFSVLNKILGENSFLTQYKGKWVILRIDEMEASHEYFFTRFDHEGNWIENTEETFIKNIGVDYSMSFMNDDAVVSLERPYKSIKETFNYQYPEELLCNIEFERGEVRSEPNLTLPTSEGTYELECWTKQKFPGDNSTAIQAATNDAYIKRFFEYGYEKDRYLVLTSGPSADVEGVMSQPVSISIKDKIELSVDWRLASNVGSGDGNLSVAIFNVLIISDIGQYHYLENPAGGAPVWTGPFGGQRNISIQHFWIPDTTDETQWVNISVSAPPAPVSGKLYIGLYKEWQGAGVYEVDTYFANLNLELIPQINGSYQRFTGQVHTVSQDNVNIKAVREAEVFISDAPRVAMKGALLKEGNGQTIFTGTVSFGDIGQFSTDGNHVGSFNIGDRITITGSVSNNVTGTITDVNFSIIGDTTTVFTDATTTMEADVAVVIQKATYVLAGRFYNAALLTAGPSSEADKMPFGQIQAFDIWNQFNRVMRTFEPTVDKTDSSTQLPDLIHKYILRDINPNTTNGGDDYRIFQLLHFEMDMHLCEWTCFLVEVLRTTIDKSYETHEFKYINE